MSTAPICDSRCGLLATPVRVTYRCGRAIVDGMSMNARSERAPVIVCESGVGS